MDDREHELDFAVIDVDRARRTGTPEVVFGQGKSADQIARILAVQVAAGHRALATRVDAAKAADIVASLHNARFEAIANLVLAAPLGQPLLPDAVAGPVAVVCAGTSDLPVAREASLVAQWLGLQVEEHVDVGVAGLHRLLTRIEQIRSCKAVIVVAGMEGALPSVVAGLVASPVIAVPTSVGYGAHFAGLTPLLAMINSCAVGVAVVNIDNGFGAACFARRVLADR